MKEGWNELVNSWEQITEVEIEYETNERGNNKVTNLLYSLRAEDIFA